MGGVRPGVVPYAFAQRGAQHQFPDLVGEAGCAVFGEDTRHTILDVLPNRRAVRRDHRFAVEHRLGDRLAGSFELAWMKHHVRSL